MKKLQIKGAEYQYYSSPDLVIGPSLKHCKHSSVYVRALSDVHASSVAKITVRCWRLLVQIKLWLLYRFWCLKSRKKIKLKLLNLQAAK